MNRAQRIRLMVGAVVVLGALSVAAWACKASQVRAAVAAVVPARPDLQGSLPALKDRIDAAERRAQSLWRPIGGLAELARLYHANGFLAEAEACARGLTELDPANPRWRYLRAQIVGGYGDLEQAVPLLERTIDLAPGYWPARIRLGNTLLKRNEPAQAAAAFRQVPGDAPGSVHALLGLARAELADGQVAAARHRLQGLVEAQPHFEPARALLISLDEQTGNAAMAAARRQQAPDTGRAYEMPDPWIDELMVDCYDPYRLAVAAAAADPANHQARARQLLERAVDIAPQDDLAFRLLGNLLSDLGELTAARGYLERATVINPKNPDNWSYLLNVLKALGDMPAANRTLDAGLAHCPDAPILHLERGRRLAAAGQLDAATAAFKQSHRLRPHDSSASMELARVYFRRDRLEDGVAELRQVVQIDPDHPVAVVLLARYAISQGAEAEALKWINQARQIPRVPAGDMDRVAQEFRQQFGRAP